MNTPKKALILAAGFGSRLAPITDNVPKSLVPVNGKTHPVQAIENLIENGISDITIISGYKAGA
jgi:CTP:phosphocholine cytidylyltransferase-like protein